MCSPFGRFMVSVLHKQAVYSYEIKIYCHKCYLAYYLATLCSKKTHQIIIFNIKSLVWYVQLQTSLLIIKFILEQALFHHRISYFLESGNGKEHMKDIKNQRT